MKNISIAFCFDNAYCPLAAGAIASLIRHANEQFQYEIYVLHDNISIQNQYLINTINKKNNVKITFKEIEFGKLTTEDLSYSRHTEYTFTRLFLHKIFPNLDRIIFLDGDIIVLSDISELFNSSLDGFAIGACYDSSAQDGAEKLKTIRYAKKIPGFEEYETPYDYYSKYLQLTDNEINSYFNAGVVLFDLKKARPILDKELPILLKKKYAWQDQDLLNLIFKEDKKILDQKFNVFVTRITKFISDRSICPVIIHYAGVTKPTDTMVNPMSYRYWEDIAQTHYYFPALERFINIKIANQTDITNDPHAIENLFYNLKHFNKIHRKRKIIRLLIRFLVDGKKYKKFKRDPSRFFADSKNTFIRFLGRLYNA